jgi:hypothetical protein
MEEYGVKGLRWGSGRRPLKTHLGYRKGSVKLGRDLWTGEGHWVPEFASRPPKEEEKAESA